MNDLVESMNPQSYIFRFPGHRCQNFGMKFENLLSITVFGKVQSLEFWNIWSTTVFRGPHPHPTLQFYKKSTNPKLPPFFRANSAHRPSKFGFLGIVCAVQCLVRTRDWICWSFCLNSRRFSHPNRLTMIHHENWIRGGRVVIARSDATLVVS